MKKISTPNHPRQLDTNLRFKHTFRFTTTSSITGQQITVGDLAASAGVLNVASAMTNYLLAASLKLHRVEIWTPAISTGAYIAGSCTILFQGGNNSSLVEKNDISVSLSEPAHVCTSPPPRSNAAYWQQVNGTTGTNLFAITCGAGSIIDVTIEWIQLDGQTPTSFTSTNAGVIGQVYYLGLDRFSGGTNWTPIGLNTLV